MNSFIYFKETIIKIAEVTEEINDQIVKYFITKCIVFYEKELNNLSSKVRTKNLHGS